MWGSEGVKEGEAGKENQLKCEIPLPRNRMIVFLLLWEMLSNLRIIALGGKPPLHFATPYP